MAETTVTAAAGAAAGGGAAVAAAGASPGVDASELAFALALFRGVRLLGE